jgi:cytochrome c oxidase subunit 2
LPAAAQPWVVAPASDGAEVISQLFWFTLILATIVFVLVEGLLIYSSLRFRRRAPLPTIEPPQIHGNTRLEVMWATVPALILIGLFGITVLRLGELSQIPNDPNALRISVTGRQFQWEFGYGTSGVKTTNELHIPIGQSLIFDVTSMDVIHSFWVPDLYGKIDANPGRVNHITFKAKQAGEYRGVCAELCGAGHSGMLFRVQAVTQSEFQTWLQQQQSGAPPAAPAGPLTDPATIDAGKALIGQKGCGTCHTIPGIAGANGNIGPSLAGVASRNRIAGGGVPNNGPDDLKKWIMNPPALKPGTAMPNLGLTDDEATKIVAFLETLK